MKTISFDPTVLPHVLSGAKTQVLTLPEGVILPQPTHVRQGETWNFLNEATHINLFSEEGEWCWIYGANWGGNITRLTNLDNPGSIPNPPHGVPGDVLRIEGTNQLIMITALSLKRLQGLDREDSIKLADTLLPLDESISAEYGAKYYHRFTPEVQRIRGAMINNWETQHGSNPETSWDANPWVMATTYRLHPEPA